MGEARRKKQRAEDRAKELAAMRWPRRWWEMTKDGWRALDRWVKDNDVDIDM